MTDKKNVLILGATDQFGEHVVQELASGDNALLLCGNDQPFQQRLAEKYADHVKGVTVIDSHRNHKMVQSMVERVGSLDALIYLVPGSDQKSFLEQSCDQVREAFNATLTMPACLLQALYPYLRKSADCKVVFVDTEVFVNQAQCSSVTHLAGHYGLWGFCEGIKAEFQAKGIEVQSISAPAIFYSTRDWVDPEGGSLGDHYYKAVIRKILEVLKSTGKVPVRSSPPAGRPVSFGHTG